jgi:3-oxoacyl-[acyl-carrier-protein] synthase II
MKPVREVVVTGMGVVSSIGIGVDAFWESLLSGKSGVGFREGFADPESPIRLAAPVTGFDAKLYVKPRKAIKIMCNPIQYGCAAANIAFEDAGFSKENPGPLNADRVGTLFGTETFFADPNEVARVFRSCTIDENYEHDRWGEFAMRQIQPLWMLRYLPNMAASHISIAIDARGPSNSICQGEASSMLALIEAADLIQRGAADVVIAGGTGSQMALTSMLYRGVAGLSTRVNDPEKACRPFDADRDGSVVGEGSGVVVLESREFAESRGANMIAKLSGYARSYCHPIDGDREAAFSSSIEQAIGFSEIGADKIGLYSANASGDIVGDAQEANAVAKSIGDTPVVAFKSHFGNTGPGTSMLELIGGLLALKHQTIPGALNCDQLDPKCKINVSSDSRPLEHESLVKTSYSATGQIVSVVFEKAN